jgi:arylsulfatase A-like enzyme
MAGIVDRVQTLPFLPAVLQERGYATAAFTSSVMVRTLEPFFDTYRMTQDDGSTAAFYETTHNAMQWLDEHGRDREFLLWIHYWDAHAPYEPIAEYDLFASGSEDRFESDRASYDGEIRFLDHKIDMILDKLDELELDDETIVIIVSDHGENFGEHDCSDFTGKDQRCKGHYVSLLEPEIKVPLVMRIPGVRSTRVNEIVQTVDLLPTVLELLGLESEHALDGRSVLPLVRGEAQGPRYSYAELKKKKRSSKSLIWDRWKLITIADEENDRTTTKLYDLEHGEYDDLSTLDPETAIRLERGLRDLVQGKQLVPETIDEESEQMLRALGYIE